MKLGILVFVLVMLIGSAGIGGPLYMAMTVEEPDDKPAVRPDGPLVVVVVGVPPSTTILESGSGSAAPQSQSEGLTKPRGMN